MTSCYLPSHTVSPCSHVRDQGSSRQDLFGGALPRRGNAGCDSVVVCGSYPLAPWAITHTDEIARVKPHVLPASPDESFCCKFP